MYIFKFADIGEGLHEGKVGEIYVEIGASVEEGAPLFSVETDKVTSDIPSPVGGKISKILITTGTTVHVGDAIFHIDDGSTTTSTKTPAPTPAQPPKTAAKPMDEGASVVGSIAVSDAPMTTFGQATTTSGQLERVLATPYARKLAASRGIVLASVTGTGVNGRILSKDIENHATPPVNAGSSAPAGVPLAPFTKPVSAMRTAIAKAMVNSWQNVAYTNLATEVNMTKLWEERKSLVAYTESKYGVRISFTALVAMATIKALRDFPDLNAKYIAAENVLKHDGAIHLGIAVDTPKGLVVPVIKDAHTKNVVEIARTIKSLATKARAGKLVATDMSGGTFTITNYGSAGAMLGVPVINYPEIAILGTGMIVDRVFANDQSDFYNGKVMHLTLAADHRWVDGAMIGRFIAAVKSLLESPILLLGGI